MHSVAVASSLKHRSLNLALMRRCCQEKGDKTFAVLLPCCCTQSYVMFALNTANCGANEVMSSRENSAYLEIALFEMFFHRIEISVNVIQEEEAALTSLKTEISDPNASTVLQFIGDCYNY